MTLRLLLLLFAIWLGACFVWPVLIPVTLIALIAYCYAAT